MARYYVEKDGEWNIFSTIVDDFILDEFVCLDALKARLLYERYKELTEDIDSLLTDKPRVNVMDYKEAMKRRREQTEPQTEGIWHAGYKTGYDKGYKDAQKVKDSQDLVKDLVKAFCENGTWLERQGVYTLTLAEAKQRAIDIIESVLAKTENNSEKPNNWEDFFREPTAEERKAVADYIDSISVPTGVNVFDLMDEPQKSCSTCGYSPQTPSCDTCDGYSNWWSLDDEPQTGQPCDGCEYSKPYIEYKCTHHSCKFEDEPQTEREDE